VPAGEARDLLVCARSGQHFGGHAHPLYRLADLFC
jgi:hypothetical protein